MSKKGKMNFNKSKSSDVNNYEKIIIKILIVGEIGVGKSNFIYRYIEDKFSSSNLASVGFDSNIKVLNYGNKKIIVQLWDTAGQSLYKSITQNLFKRVQGIIVLYDITNIKSFESVEKWINIIEEENKKIIYEIAGNKCDLNDSREVDINEGKKLSQKYKAIFFETSAKMNINIIESINNLVKKILDNLDLETNPTFTIDNRSYEIIGKSSNEKCC